MVHNSSDSQVTYGSIEEDLDLFTGGSSTVSTSPTVCEPDDDDGGPDPTHECTVCGEQTYVESEPRSTYSWCTDRETVVRYEWIR
jgi:hypothetical protein